MRNLLLAGTAVVALVAGAASVSAQSEDPNLRRPPAGQSQDRGGNAGGPERNRGQDAQRPDADQGGARRNQAGQADEQPTRRNQADQGDQQPRRNQQGQAEEQQQRRNQQGQADEQPRRNQPDQAGDQQPRRNQQGQAEDQQPRRNQQGQAGDQQPRRNQQGGDRDQADTNDRDRNRNQADTNERDRNRNQADTNERDRNRNQADRGGDRDNDRIRSRVNIVTKLDAPRRQKVVVSFRERAKPLPRADFRIDIGVNVPRTVTLNPIPDVIIREVPEYRSYRFVIVENEILIIEPDTYRIVEIIPEDSVGGGPRSASLTIDRTKFSVIKRDLRPRARVVERQITLREGDDVPDDIELEAVPDVVIREVPQLRTYRYVYLQNEVVIVDPDSRRVVEVIQ